MAYHPQQPLTPLDQNLQERLLPYHLLKMHQLKLLLLQEIVCLYFQELMLHQYFHYHLKSSLEQGLPFSAQSCHARHALFHLARDQRFPSRIWVTYCSLLELCPTSSPKHQSSYINCYFQKHSVCHRMKTQFCPLATHPRHSGLPHHIRLHPLNLEGQFSHQF